MSELIAHRGPDGQGAWTNGDQSVGLAHRRLSIIDPSEAGRQPMISDAQIISHNGEIYNYLELRRELGEQRFRTRTDTETILKGWETWGDKVVDHLRGMFAFALWDQNEHQLLLARDRFGIKPMYYYVSPEQRLYFASEAKALLPFVPQIKTDADGLRDYLVFQQPLEGKTLFQGIDELPAAHLLRVTSQGEIKVSRYWEVVYGRDFDKNDEDFVEETAAALQDSVNLHLRADVPIGAYISGGLDSSLIASLAADQSSILGFTGFSKPARFDERLHARVAASKAGIELLETEVTAENARESLTDVIYHLDYPVAGPGSLPQYVVSNLAAQHRKVVLGGQGGDEIFGGYVRYLLAYFEQCMKGAIDQTLRSADFVVTYESIIPSLSVLEPYKPLMKEFFSSGLFEPMDRRYLKLMDRGTRLGSELLVDIEEDYSPRETFLRLFNSQNVENGSFFDAMTHVDFKTLLPALLQVEDRVGMAHGLEARVPLLDHRIVELAATMPADVKFKDGNLKRVLKEVARNHIPDSIIDRKDKMGFPVPVVDWFRGPLNNWVHEIFDQGARIGREYVDSKAVPTLLAGEGGYDRTFWGYISLEIWQQQFHDRQAHFSSLNPDNIALTSRPLFTNETLGGLER